MFRRPLVFLAVLGLLLMSVAAHAAVKKTSTSLLMPLKTGQWMEFDKSDALSPSPDYPWTERMDVYSEQTIQKKQYFYIFENNYDPYEGDMYDYFWIRSTATQVYKLDSPTGKEYLVFKTGKAGDSWKYIKDGVTHRKEIVSTNDVLTIPGDVIYGHPGGTYTAYKYKHYNIATPDQFTYEWVVPGLGLVKEEDHWVSNPSRIPVIGKLARVGANPLISLQTGTVLTFNSTDGSQNWHMTIRVMEQVSLGGYTYYHCVQSNFYPSGGDVDLYLRADDRQVYMYDSYAGEYVVFRVGNIGDYWTRPSSGAGYEVDTIVDIVDLTVPYGGPYKAYKVQRSQSYPYALTAYEYMVPGLWLARQDTWDSPSITHVLAGVTQPYTENFESGKATGWKPNNPACWRVVADGTDNKVYQAATPSIKQISMVSTYTGATWSNFVYQADVKQVKAKPYGYAAYIIFRATANFSANSGGSKKDAKGSGYAFGIDDGNSQCPTPCFAVFKILNGQFIPLTNDSTTGGIWLPSGYINPTTSVNTLKVSANGADLIFYINGNLVFSYNDSGSPILSGRIGLMGYTDRFGVTAHKFDNLYVESLP